MKVSEAYRLAIETGMSKDPRPRDEVDMVLKEAKDTYDSLSEDRKELYDTERLWNPYGDSRFMWGWEKAEDTEAERFMWGIDMDTSEVLLADRLKEKGETISALVGHHPFGKSRTPFPEVMDIQNRMYDGVPINVLEGLLPARKDEVQRNVLGSNYNKAVDAARMLDILMFNVHSPADNMVQDYLETMFREEEPKYIQDIIDRLLKEPEFRYSAKYNDPPRVMVGNKKNHCGKVIFKMTGGTSGPKEIYEKLAQAGVGTVVAMHFPDNHIEEARKNNINLIISGHMASDSLGINLICDVWEKKGIETVGCSGFIRHSRN